MYNCDNCGKTSNAGERANKVVVTREKTYQENRYEYDPKKRKKVKVSYETQGYEIHQELNFCSDCYKVHGEN